MLAALINLGLCALGTGCGGGGGGGSAAAPAAGSPPAAVASSPAPAAAAGTSSGNAGGSAGAAGDGTSTDSAASPSNTSGRATALSFGFDLSAPRSTSAGIYGPDGRLLRTLWSNRRLAAGHYQYDWDLRDDAGALQGDGRYTVKLIHHDVQYVWEGAAGNSSADMGSALPHRAYHGPSALAYAGGRMHYGLGYNEGGPMVVGFDIAKPQRPLLDLSSIDPFSAAQYIATDGARVYWANTGGFNKANFVAAYDLASGQVAPFSEGASICMVTMSDGHTCYPNATYTGVVALHADSSNPPTGIAVQTGGPVLAVAFGLENVVRLFDKTTGRALGSLPVALAAGTGNHLAMAPNGDLWVLTSDGAQRWTSLTGTPRLAAQVSGLTRPLAVAVDPQDAQSVWIAEGGSRQQVRHLDASGRTLGALGRAGGCTVSTAVTSDRLCFLLTPTSEQTGLAVDGDHALWVVDTSNNRMLRFDRNGNPAEGVSFLPATYAIAVDPGDPTRVFANFLEFRVDYTKTLTEPGGWTLVRNWLPTLPAALRDANAANREWGGFFAVRTLSNGRTYGMLRANNQQALVELGADGQLRTASAVRTPAANESVPVLYANGSLGYARTDGSVQRVLTHALERFDGQGNPVWSSQPTTLATVPADAASPAFRIGTFTGLSGAQFPVTSSGQLVFFNPSVDASTSYHLGAVTLGGSGTWNWRTSRSGATDGRGAFQTHSDDSQIQYGGNLALASGRNVLFGYHGEFWTDPLTRKTGQANQFMHYYDNGLFVGQFGVPSTRATKTYGAGVGGNSFALELVRSGGATYLYHNDEWGSGGVVRWRLQGVDDIRELSGSATLSSSSVTLR